MIDSMNTGTLLSNYLQYGGILRVVRADGANLNNANVGGMPSTHPTGIGSTSSLKIKSFEDYQNNYEDAVTYQISCKKPRQLCKRNEGCIH